MREIENKESQVQNTPGTRTIALLGIMPNAPLKTAALAPQPDPRTMLPAFSTALMPSEKQR